MQSGKRGLMKSTGRVSEVEGDVESSSPVRRKRR
jgi:hypothetical protein